MKLSKSLGFILFLGVVVSSTLAGDKEDAQATVEKAIAAFNKHDFPTYFSLFVDDNTEFPGVESPLRYDAAMWKEFNEQTTSLEYVNYHQQDVLVQTYNRNTAVVTGYFTFKSKPKGGDLHIQSGRASVVLVKQNGKWLIAHMHFSKMF